MDKFLEKLNRMSRIAMDPSRKAALRTNLISFMDARPLAEPASVNFMFARRFLAPAGAFALLVFAVGGSSLAAEKALPGDPLYVLKLKLNEPLVAALKVSDMAKTEWQTQIAVRRLEEADQLAISNQLNDGAKDQIEENFKLSSDKASVKIEALSRKKGDEVAALNISTEFESALKAHSEILAQLGERQGNDSDSLKTAAIAALTKVSEASGKKNTGAVSDKAASAKITLAKKAIFEVKEYIDKNSGGFGAEAKAAAEARMQKADSSLASAEAEFKAGAWGDAFSSANRALRVAQETKILAQAQLAASKSVAESQAPTDARIMGIAAKRSLNLLSDSDTEAGFGAAAIMAAPSSTELEAKSSVSSSPSDPSNTLNADEIERNVP